MLGYEFKIEDTALVIYGMVEQVAGKNLNDSNPTAIGEYDAKAFSFGLNWRPESWLIVKYQTQLGRFDDPRGDDDIDYHALSLTVFFK